MRARGPRWIGMSWLGTRPVPAAMAPVPRRLHGPRRVVLAPWVAATAWTIAAAVLLLLVPAVHAAPRIVITRPHAYQVHQRGVTGRGTIVVRGRAEGFAGPVQVRWAGGAWRTVSGARDGSFVRPPDAEAAGQGTSSCAALASHEIRALRDAVGVGDIYVIAGQSNASGRSRFLFTVRRTRLCSAGLFGNDDRWRRLTDPVDSAGRTGRPCQPGLRRGAARCGRSSLRS